MIFVFHLSFSIAFSTILSHSSLVKVGLSAVVQRSRTPSTFHSICCSKSTSKATKSILLFIQFPFLKGVTRAVHNHFIIYIL